MLGRMWRRDAESPEGEHQADEGVNRTRKQREKREESLQAVAGDHPLHVMYLGILI